jgi:hypothetical protein
MEKAIISLLDERKAEITRKNVQFNPSEFSTDQSAQYVDAFGLSQKKVGGNQFLAEESTYLNLRLTYDGFTAADTLDPEKASDVNPEIGFLRKLIVIDEKLHRPPICVFEWGSFKFCGYAEYLKINYSMFASSGKPIRATADIRIRSNADLKIPLQSPDRTKRHVVSQETPLYMVSYEAYNDCSQWRHIAKANELSNPRRLRAGTILKIPPLEFEPI